MSLFPHGWFSGNIVLVPFDKGIQRGENAFYIYDVGIALDAVPAMVFAKILPKEPFKISIFFSYGSNL